MANYPQLDNVVGVWKLHEVYDAVMGGYWRNANGGSRALFMGGQTPSLQTTIDFINMVAPGDATDFGDLTQARTACRGASNTTRCVFMGGMTPSTVNTIDYITIGSTGNATDFGDLTYTTTAGAGGNSNGHGGLA